MSNKSNLGFASVVISALTAGFGLLLGIFSYLSHGEWPELSAWIISLSFFGFVGGVLLQPSALEVAEENKRRLSLILDDVDRLVTEHRSALAKNLATAIKRDDYGRIKIDNRKMIWTEFFESVGIRDFSSPEIYKHAAEILNKLEISDREIGFNVSSLPSSGRDFEIWVADSLEKFGWRVEVTKGSGDQGIDVIALRNNRRLGIQCKLYSGKIGNKAVQEAHTGKAHYRLDAAAVLTNSQFTSAACHLADSTGTYLLSHFDIPVLHQKIPGFD